MCCALVAGPYLTTAMFTGAVVLARYTFSAIVGGWCVGRRIGDGGTSWSAWGSLEGGRAEDGDVADSKGNVLRQSWRAAVNSPR